MRVLHLLKTAVGARWALHQVRELIALGVDVHVSLPPGPMVERFAQTGANTHLLQTDIAAYRPWQWPAMFRALNQMMDLVRPDLLHSHSVGATVTMRLALTTGDVPRIFQVPGPLHLEHPLFARGELALADQRDYWIAACRWTRDAYHAYGIGKRRTFLSYNTTDVASFTPRPASGSLRRALGLGDRTRMVGMVAYLYSPKRYLGQRRGLKGHEDLIDAIAYCRSQGLDVVGVIVGGPWGNNRRYEAQVHAYAAARCPGGIHFLGTRDDVRELYAEFDLAAHPSLSENVGGALESSLMGIPTITTAVGGFPDLVIPGETGWLVPPADPRSLAAGIAQALADPQEARRMGANARAKAIEVFSPARLGRELRDIYHTILTDR